MIIPFLALAPDYLKSNLHPIESCPSGRLKSPHWLGTEMASDTRWMSYIKSRDVPLSTWSILDHWSSGCFLSIFKECLDLWHKLHKQTRDRSPDSSSPQDRLKERGFCFACSHKTLPGLFLLNSGYFSPFCLIAASPYKCMYFFNCAHSRMPWHLSGIFCHFVYFVFVCPELEGCQG